MSSVIRIEGRIDKDMASFVKNSLRTIPQGETEVVFIINSHGGERDSLERIKGYMYFVKKYKNCKIIGQLEYGESAGLLLFLNCDKDAREVTSESIGVIHLPISSDTRESLPMADPVVVETISFITRRTDNKISEKEIIEFENVPLGDTEMLYFGIATKKVPSFENVDAEFV